MPAEATSAGVAVLPLPVSVIVMTRDEALNLPACLASCTECAEVFVVDSGSRDATREIARDAGARLVDFCWDGHYPKKKQWCLESLPLTQPWTLLLDADERLTPALVAELRQCLSGPATPAGFYLSARVGFAGRLLRFGRRHAKLALFRTGAARFSPVDDLRAPGGWEVEGHYQPLVDGPVGFLRQPMIHWDLKPADDWRARHDGYASWAAAMRLSGALDRLVAGEPRPRRWAKRLLAVLPGRPWLVLADSFLLRLGLLDGRAGWAYARARFGYYRAIDRQVRRMRLARSAAAQATPQTGREAA